MAFALAGRPQGKTITSRAELPAEVQPPTQDVIMRALGSLGIAEINKALAAGTFPPLPSPVREDGPGWRAEVDLPYGVTATQVIDRREQLASGLRRPLGAVWPEPVSHEHAGRLELWVGRADISKARPPVWPLLRSGQANIFEPQPFGIDVRGRPVAVPMAYLNWLVGAIPRQGKTAAARVLTCTAALDPLAEMWIHELKGSGDLDPLESCAHRFMSGIDDEAIAYAAESLKLLRREIERRTDRLKALPRELCPDKRVTREIAAKRRLKLWPIVCVIDEAQNLFTHDKYGKAAGDDATFIIKIGPGVRRGPDPGHPAAGLQVPADRGQQQRRAAVLPEGDGPDRQRHGARHLGVQERHPGHHVPARDRRRARLPRRRHRGGPGGPHLLPGHGRHREDRGPGPGAARGRPGRCPASRSARTPACRSATSWPTSPRCSAPPAGCTGSRSPTSSPRGSPTGGTARPVTRCAPSAPRAACRPWSS